MRPRANLRRSLHHLHLARTLHAPQRTNERRERAALRSRRSNNVQIGLRLCCCCVVVGVLAAREVFEEEPCSRDAPVVVVVVVAVLVLVWGMVVGNVSVDVFGAGDEGAQVVCECVEGPRVVCSEERDDICKARRCAVPFFFGGILARAVEQHAEAARRAVLLWQKVTRHARGQRIGYYS